MLESGRLSSRLSPAPPVAGGTSMLAAPRGPLVLPRLLPHQRCHDLSRHHVWQSAPATTQNGLMDGTRCTGSAWRWEFPGKLGSRSGTKHQLDSDGAWRRVGKAKVRARCARSGAGQHTAAGLGCAQHPQVPGRLQEQRFGWERRG